MVEQGFDRLGTSVEVDRVITVLRRLPVAGHVPQVHREVIAKRIRIARPHRRGERGSVTEDHIRAGAGPATRDRPSLRGYSTVAYIASGSSANASVAFCASSMATRPRS